MRIELWRSGELVGSLPEIRDEIVELRFVRFEEFIDALDLSGIVGLVRLREQVLHRLVHGSRVLPANGVRVAAKLGDPTKQILFDLRRCVLVGQRAAPVRSTSVFHVLPIELVHGPAPVEVLGRGLRRYAFDHSLGVVGDGHGLCPGVFRNADDLVVVGHPKVTLVNGDHPVERSRDRKVALFCPHPRGAVLVQPGGEGRAGVDVVQGARSVQAGAGADAVLDRIGDVLHLDVQDRPHVV